MIFQNIRGAIFIAITSDLAPFTMNGPTSVVKMVVLCP